MPDPRVAQVMGDLFRAINGIIEKHQITQDEYRAAVAYLDEVAQAGETMLLCDVFVESEVVANENRQQRGTHQQPLGPYYLEDSPWVEDGQLATPEEEGERLLVTGTVRDVDGSPIEGAVIDFWQSDGKGRYGAFDIPPRTNMNLRGRLHSKRDGSYAVHTVVPAPYTIPHEGPTGRLLLALDRHPWRPAHVHLKAGREGYRTLITQIYFKGDRYLESDAVRAMDRDLVYELKPDGNGHRVDFDIVLEDAV